MERRKSRYEELVIAHRDTLTDDEMEMLLVLDEQPIKALAAQALGISPEELETRFSDFMAKHSRPERTTNQGKPFRKRLTQSAIIGILADHPDLNEQEREILQSLLGANNQVVAALSLDMTYSAFIKRYMEIRHIHGF